MTAVKNWGELCEKGPRPPPATLTCVEVTWFADGLFVPPLFKTSLSSTLEGIMSDIYS